MFSKTYSYGINGLDAYPICIEVDASRGLPATIIVGLPDNAIKESKERVRSAIKNSGHKYKLDRITINLSPADTRKEGPAFDLSIAIGILSATQEINFSNLNQYAMLGELSLDGKIRPINGSLSIALSMKKDSFKGLILPLENAVEAAMANGIDIYPAGSLNQVIQFLLDPTSIKPFQTNNSHLIKKTYYGFDFSDVKGQTHVKRGLEVAAAGNHNVILIGSPGTGKSMISKRLATIMPDLDQDEIIEVTRIHSVMGLIKTKTGMITQRPFRSPHHTTSDIALIGGGSNPRPGEVTLAHHGILFLDELPEFNRNALEVLRQPLEEKEVVVARAARTVRFPANFMFVAAMNPCPCGWHTDPKKECRCSSWQIQRYLSKISGPLLDRIDIHLEVPSLPSKDLFSNVESETSIKIKQRTVKAREIQRKRFEGRNVTTNAQLNHQQIKEFCPLSQECRDLLEQTVEKLNLSARAHDKILKVARTIADLANEENILSQHVAEAIQYRSLDRNWWGEL